MHSGCFLSLVPDQRSKTTENKVLFVKRVSALTVVSQCSDGVVPGSSDGDGKTLPSLMHSESKDLRKWFCGFRVGAIDSVTSAGNIHL